MELDRYTDANCLLHIILFLNMTVPLFHIYMMRSVALLTIAMLYIGAVEATPRIYPPIPTIASNNDNMMDLTGLYNLCAFL